MKSLKYFLFFIIHFSCRGSSTEQQQVIRNDTTSTTTVSIATDTFNKVQKENLNFTSISKYELVHYAKTLIGIPYKYASTDPSIGFDCSGFITYVFNHFHLAVPRSSVDFTNVGKQVNLTDADVGDLILFTGTVDSIRTVGHMGIVTENIDTLRFIHSTSGRANAVTISNFTEHYKKRFVKVVRIFSTT